MIFRPHSIHSSRGIKSAFDEFTILCSHLGFFNQNNLNFLLPNFPSPWNTPSLFHTGAGKFIR